jgi:branched-chain amino acid transport system permease protein
MTASAILIQFLNGLASASSLFLVAAGLSLIFGVTRIINFAHGSLYMLGLYIAYSLVERFGHGAAGFWGGVLLAGIIVAVVGALLESLLLRRLYGAPELLQLLATFALVLMIQDFTLWAWGPEDLLGPRAPGLDGALSIAGQRFPQYDLLLIALGPPSGSTRGGCSLRCSRSAPCSPAPAARCRSRASRQTCSWTCP